MTLRQIADQYELLVNTNAIAWLEVTPELRAGLHPFTRNFLAMFDEAGISYWLGSVELDGSRIFKLDDPVIGFFEHHPRRCLHQWVKPGYHEALSSNEALAHLIAMSGGSRECALALGQLLDRMQPARNSTDK